MSQFSIIWRNYSARPKDLFILTSKSNIVTADIPHFGVGLEDRPPSQYTVEDIPALLAVIDNLKHLVAELRAENAQMKDQIAELKSLLNQNSRNSSRPPSMDGFLRPQTPRKKGEPLPKVKKDAKGIPSIKFQIQMSLSLTPSLIALSVAHPWNMSNHLTRNAARLLRYLLSGCSCSNIVSTAV